MKHYAIEVFFEDEFDKYVRNLWELCDSHNLSAFMNRVKGTEPHIALAVYENVETESIKKRFNEFISQDLIRFELTFDAMAFFPTSNVSFLQPNTKQEFVDLMKDIHDYFQEYKPNSYYSPERWFPHVTIAKNKTVEELKNTINYLMNCFKPQITQVKKLVLVEIEYLDGEIICRNIMDKEFEDKSY